MAEANADAPELSLTERVRAAQSGLRSDVSRLVDALGTARLYVPLARPIPGVELGVDADVGRELTLSPHLLATTWETAYLPLFTEPELLEKVARSVGWTTGDEDLQTCALPSEVALEIALSVVDGNDVPALVLNPLDESELVLTRHELASIAQSRPVPLVGYVSRIPARAARRPLIAEDEPPSSELTAAVEQALADFFASPSDGPLAQLPTYVLRRTFNEECDIEPHLTLNVITEDTSVDPERLAEKLGAALEDKLPPPGYIDILLNDEQVR